MESYIITDVTQAESQKALAQWSLSLLLLRILQLPCTQAWASYRGQETPQRGKPSHPYHPCPSAKALDL